MSQATTAPTAPAQQAPARRRKPSAAANTSAKRAPRPVHPVLEQLAALHPQLFGARFLPLKLGTFQDLVARHPDVFKPEELKEALGQHTRSTRYLEAIARGVPRHDLDGVATGDTAPEHVHHAVVELFRRRQARSQEDLQPALRQRVRELFIASGLDRAGYAAAARVQAEAFSALLDAADQDQAADIARREALLRAFEASGHTVAQFADSYGLVEQDAAHTLAQARDDRRVKQSRSAA